MNMQRCFSLAVLAGIASHALAQNEAPITSVVLYPGSATIERTTPIAAGMKQVEIKGLPANFDTQTLRADADAGIQIGQIVVRDVKGTEAASAREAELEAKIQAVQDKMAVIDVDAKSAELAKNFLERLSGSGANANDKQAAVDGRAVSGVLEAIRRGGNDAFERMHKARVQKRELEKQLGALQSELARVRSGARDVRNITVNLAARQAGAIRLNYQVNNAGWKPTYRAMLDSKASTVDLERLAMVSQKTGEDWSNVKLKLSTGQPRLSPQAPEPRPWLLSYYKPQPEGAYRMRGIPAPAAAPAPSPKPAGYAQAKSAADDYIPPVIETQGSFSTEFDVPTRVTLPADGREISVALAKQSINAKQRVRVAPRLDKAAVVTAEAARPAGVWITGNMQLFRDGSYVGATHWNPQSSDKFIFSFGRDDLIRVAVDRANEQSGSSGFLTQQSQRKVADVYTLTSTHKTPVDLLVLESSPVSTSEDIKVETAFNPKPTVDTWEQRRGVVGWETVINPNQSLKFSVDYTITYPKEGSVSGLP
ncbi:MAG: mucoidy inhibitor MuiA family protein [Burkholderiales bacterium]|nr:mucoidy inhibitor MuiA family protein [Burkholderiales bacterium]